MLNVDGDHFPDLIIWHSAISQQTLTLNLYLCCLPITCFVHRDTDLERASLNSLV